MACCPQRLPVSTRSHRHRLERHYRENPAWLAKALAGNLTSMQAQVGPSYMPMITDAHPLGVKVVVDFKEYGCGAYGCVLPTHDPKIVLKVTTDASEKAFVERAMPWGWPAGISAYYGVMPLEGEYRLPKSSRGEPAWLLWRESATEVGSLDVLSPLPSIHETDRQFEDRDESFELFDLLYQSGSRIHALFFAAGDRMPEVWTRALQQRASLAQTLASSHKRDWPRILDKATKGPTPADLAIHVEAYVQTVRAMERHPTTSAVGLALSFYLERQIILADLHSGNFGIVQRDRPTWAITDPGHSAEMLTRWPE